MKLNFFCAARKDMYISKIYRFYFQLQMLKKTIKLKKTQEISRQNVKNCNHQLFFAAACDAGYIKSEGKCYKLVTQVTAGVNAEAKARAEGGHLVSINSAGENYFVKGLYG